MQRFFAAGFNGKTFYFLDEDNHKLTKVLRAKIGTEIVAVWQGCAYTAQISNLAPVTATMICEISQSNETKHLITAFIPGIKKVRVEWAVEKLTELGVAKIVLFSSRYTNHEHFDIERLKRIAREAAEQAQRNIVPTIAGPFAFDEISNHKQTFNFFGDMQSGLDRAFPTADFSIIVGPEGGFTIEEIESLRSAGFSGVNLSSTILRSETALLALVARLL